MGAMGARVPSLELDRLVATRDLQLERPSQPEFEGLLRSAEARLPDAENKLNSMDSRFDLAGIWSGAAAHALALAALRWHGYRPVKRYIVFPALAHTLDLPRESWRLLAKCHEQRNRTEYEGLAPIEEALLAGLLEVTRELLVRVRELPLPAEAKLPGR